MDHVPATLIGVLQHAERLAGFRIDDLDRVHALAARIFDHLRESLAVVAERKLGS